MGKKKKEFELASIFNPKDWDYKQHLDFDMFITSLSNELQTAFLMDEIDEGDENNERRRIWNKSN